ncbi:MAG: hypothetical protein ABI411_14840 [Tahibacter sp.]
MRAFLVVVSTTLVAIAPLSGATQQTRYLELVNRANDSVIALATAPTGSDVFTAKPLAVPLPGGGTAITVEVASESCRLDFRFTFRTGRSIVYRDVDICHHRGLHIQRLRRTSNRA